MYLRYVFSSFHIKLLFTYFLVIIVFQIVPVDIFFLWGMQKPILWEITLNHIVRVFLFFPWMIIAWLLIYEGVPTSSMLTKSRIRLHGFIWLLLGLCIAILAEISQFYIPYRAYNRVDAILNCVGVIAGFPFIFFKPHRVWRKIVLGLMGGD